MFHHSIIHHIIIVSHFGASALVMFRLFNYSIIIFRYYISYHYIVILLSFPPSVVAPTLLCFGS